MRSQLLLVALGAALGCAGDPGSVGAPEHFGPVVQTPTGPLQLQMWIWPRDHVFRDPDSVVIHYHVANPGPADQAYRDRAEDYHFRVIGPDGRRMAPVVVSATDGMGPSQRILLFPGETGEMHTIN